MYRNGELHGAVDEVDVDGFVLTRGHYHDGEPTGEWTVYFRDGGRLIGPVAGVDGLVTGDASYHYPDDTELRGQWRVRSVQLAPPSGRSAAARRAAG